MKLLRVLPVSFALLFLTGVTGAFADGSGTLTATVVNNSSYTLNGIYASSSDAGNWTVNPSNNLINGQVIPPGQSVTVSIPNNGTGGCSYDLLGELFGSNQYDYEYSLNACNGDTWTISSSS